MSLKDKIAIATGGNSASPSRSNFIDPDKERYLLLGAGYEFLRTTSQVSNENRITFDMTPNLRPASKLLLRDRNWLELRWIDGNYSTTYRNLVAAEVDLRVHNIRFTPFVTAEFFYDSPKHSWSQQWYTGGCNCRTSVSSCWKPTTGVSTAQPAHLKTEMREAQP